MSSAPSYSTNLSNASYTAGTPANPLPLAADPRAGGGQLAPLDTIGTFGGVSYKHVGNSVNDWVAVPTFQRYTHSGAAIDQYTFTVANARVYNFYYNIVPTSNSVIALYINGAATNCYSQTIDHIGAGSLGGEDAAFLFLTSCRGGTGQMKNIGWGSLFAAPGGARLFEGSCIDFDATTQVVARRTLGNYNDSSTPITSLTFYSTYLSAMIGAGSQFVIWSPIEGY